MASDLDPGAQDPDFDYLVMQLRHIGTPVEVKEDSVDAPLTERCCHSGLTIPECSCATCIRELILRYRPGTSDS